MCFKQVLIIVAIVDVVIILYIGSFCPKLSDLDETTWEHVATLQEPGLSFEKCAYNFETVKSCSMIAIDKIDIVVDNGRFLHSFEILLTPSSAAGAEIALNFSFSHATNPTMITVKNTNTWAYFPSPYFWLQDQNLGSEVVAGIKDNQLMIANVSVVSQSNTTFTKTFQLRISSPERNFCIVDASCASDIDDLRLQPTSMSNDFDPSLQDFLYDSKVSYQCGKALPDKWQRKCHGRTTKALDSR